MKREALLARLRSTPEWDVLIIGGGATGLGCAVDAAARGYTTLLLEAHDFARYAALQLEERKQARFPPYAANALLFATAPEVAIAIDWLKEARALAAPLAQAFGVQVFDPVPMRMVRLARRERAQLLVEALTRPTLQAFLSAWSTQLWPLKPPRDLRWHLDVDPAEV